MIISYSKQSIKFLKKQDMITRKRIIKSIENLPLGDVKNLQGVDNYRLRVGDYRIIYNQNGNVIRIERIDSRGQVYRR